MSLPYFPMYPTDFEADTSHLTLAEDGAYNRLLRLMWMTPGCSLPDDDTWIMRRMRCVTDEDCEVVANVISEFFHRKGGRVISPRLAKEYQKTDLAHRKRVAAGSRGGKAKALAQNEKPPSKAKAMPKQPEPEPEPEEVDKSTSTQEAVKYQEYLKAHPNPVASDAGFDLFSELVADGTDPDQIIAAAKAYAETVKGWSAEAKVQQSDNFLDPERGKWRHQVTPKAVPTSTPEERLTFWANAINGDGFIAPSSISPAMAAALVERELVTPDRMKQRGIAA